MRVSVSGEILLSSMEPRFLIAISRPSRRVQKCYLANFNRQLPIFSNTFEFIKEPRGAAALFNFKVTRQLLKKKNSDE